MFACEKHGLHRQPRCERCQTELSNYYVAIWHDEIRKEQAMKTPTDEQLRDPKWWDENAPEGATHFAPQKFGWDAGVFWRIEKGAGVEAWAITDRGFVYYPEPTWTEDSFVGAVQRPTPNAYVSEWDGVGLPPVGCECECMRHGLWVKCEIGAHGEDHACPVAFAQTEFDCQVLDERMFRPLRSQAERERREVIEAAKQVVKDEYGVEFLEDEIAERELGALYDAGMLRKGGAE